MANGDNIAPPSFDRTKGMRGSFAHRRGEQPEDERRSAEFWEARDLSVERLEISRGWFSRQPDLRLLRDGAPFAYCEVKTIWRHVTKTRILHEDGPVEERVEVTKATVEERLTTDLVSAIRQLRYANPDHLLLNIVLLVSHDAEASPDCVESVLNRPPRPKGRGLAAKRATREYEELEQFRRDVDLCLWANPAAKKGLLIERCFLFNPTLRSFAEEITGLRGTKLVSLEPAA